RPDFLIDGPGESAALVAKKFRFEQAGGNGSAVDLDESAVAARAAIVDGACKEFFAGSRFAEEQHGRSRGSGEFHLREGAFQHGALADNFLKIEFAADFFFEIEFFFGELV